MEAQFISGNGFTYLLSMLEGCVEGRGEIGGLEKVFWRGSSRLKQSFLSADAGPCFADGPQASASEAKQQLRLVGKLGAAI
jgi:hypothetical protein